MVGGDLERVWGDYDQNTWYEILGELILKNKKRTKKKDRVLVASVLRIPASGFVGSQMILETTFWAGVSHYSYIPVGQ